MKDQPLFPRVPMSSHMNQKVVTKIASGEYINIKHLLPSLHEEEEELKISELDEKKPFILRVDQVF